MEATDGVDVVLQAAALKQVPTCERYPMEAVRTNVLGAENVVEAALAHEVESVVAISTDKAVKPVNAMGMTKALQERIVLGANQSKANHGTRFAVVRYGNVLRSRGSVVPVLPPPARARRAADDHGRADDALPAHAQRRDRPRPLRGRGGGAAARSSSARRPPLASLDIGRVLCEEAGVPFDYRLHRHPARREDRRDPRSPRRRSRRTEDRGDYYSVHPFGPRRAARTSSREYSARRTRWWTGTRSAR